MEQQEKDEEAPAPAVATKEPEEEEEFLPGFPSVTAFSQEGFKKIVAATKAFQSLPAAGPAWDLQKSYPEFNRAMKNARSTLTPMIASLLKHVHISPDEFKAGDIDEKFDFLVEANDDMLERIGRALDEASGLFKKAETIVVNPSSSATSKPPGVWAERKLISEQKESGPTYAAADAIPGVAAASITNNQIRKLQRQHRVREKPQIHFKVPVDNSTLPFVPKLKEKPHSIKPLSILPEYNSMNEEYFGHPYLVELTRWEPSDSMLTTVEPQNPKKLDETPLIQVSTTRDLNCMLKDLMYVKELAVDLEHHSYRSFLGLTCLMQISTRDKDYIIDGFTLREDLYLLNDIFADPKIVKVFHGAAYDIEWLQKDFGLYVVNMFDTQVAAKTLNFPFLGLQHLLQHFCGITQNKAHQLADWRIRPIPDDMLHYARQDTHFLLYIYDKMRNQLLESGNDSQLKSVYEGSKALCLKRYEKPSNNPNLAIRKMRRSLNNRQLYAFTELYKWRDMLARERDESVGYILPNHMLLSIAEQLPKEMSGILACCEPVPPSVHAHLGKIRRIVTTARELPLQERAAEEKTEKRPKLQDWVIVMNSVHDVTLQEVSKSRSGKAKEKASRSDSTDATNEEEEAEEEEDDNVWPKPLKELKDPNIQVLKKPSMFFNHKVTINKPNANKTVDGNDSQQSKFAPKIEAAATPFERYQLSNEIMELLKDPKAKEVLDMENPIVRAVYETVFLDPTEDLEEDKAEVPQVLEKVFTEGEFIPFNPLADGPSTSKKRKKKDKYNPWDDSNTKREKLDPEVTEVPSNVNDAKSKTSSTREVVKEDLEEGELNSSFEGGDRLFSLGSEEPDSKSSESKKGNKNKKKKNKQSFLNKLKNSFGKNKKKKGGTHKDAQGDGQADQPSDFDNQTAERRQSPRKHSSTLSNMVPNPAYNARNSPKHSGGDLRHTQSTPNVSANHGRNRNSNPGSGGGGRGGRGSPAGSGRRDGAGRGRGGRGRGGGNKFFEFKSRGGGRSMTFK